MCPSTTPANVFDRADKSMSVHVFSPSPILAFTYVLRTLWNLFGSKICPLMAVPHLLHPNIPPRYRFSAHQTPACCQQ